MKTADVNRSVLLVRPRALYLEWAAANGDGMDYPVDHERTTYLVPVYGDATEGESVLRRHCAAIFEAELEAWCTDESTWPRRQHLCWPSLSTSSAWSAPIRLVSGRLLAYVIPALAELPEVPASVAECRALAGSGRWVQSPPPRPAAGTDD
jgi:hypothetical protein